MAAEAPGLLFSEAEPTPSHSPTWFKLRATEAPCEYVDYDIFFLMSPDDKPLVWLSGVVKTPPFSAEARLEAGFLLRRLQQGEKVSLPHSRPMPSVGGGCHELRIVDREATWRIMYFVDADAIVILDVFKKKTRATPKNVIETSKSRLQAYQNARSG
jgi:phage-related protein